MFSLLSTSCALTDVCIVVSMSNAEPRAFLLPLLAQPHPSSLSHFVSYFVPLSERMFDLQQKAEIEGRQSEAKVWSVLVGQVWTGLAGYCSGPNLKQVCLWVIDQQNNNHLLSVFGPGILTTSLPIAIWATRTSACNSESTKSYGGFQSHSFNRHCRRYYTFRGTYTTRGP